MARHTGRYEYLTLHRSTKADPPAAKSDGRTHLWLDRLPRRRVRLNQYAEADAAEPHQQPGACWTGRRSAPDARGAMEHEGGDSDACQKDDRGLLSLIAHGSHGRQGGL